MDIKDNSNLPFYILRSLIYTIDNLSYCIYKKIYYIINDITN